MFKSTHPIRETSFVRITIVALLASIAGIALTFAQDGTLDTTFDTDGWTTTSFPNDASMGAGIAIQPDGKIIVVGGGADNFTTMPTNMFLVARYNADGSLDTSFDGDGRVRTSVPGQASGSEARAVTVQSDGKIVVVGSLSFQRGVVIRYHANGSLDTTFDGDGIAVTDLGGDEGQYEGVEIDASGKIVVGGTGNGDAVAARYNTDGSLDTTFDGDGIAFTGFAGGGFAEGWDVAIDQNGRIVVVGHSDFGGFAVARFNTNGSLDTTFDSDGRATATGDLATGVAIDAANKIVVSGPVANQAQLGVKRFNTNGSLDTSFSGDGQVGVTVAGFLFQPRVAIQTDGKIVAGGGDSSLNLIRLLADGTLDTTFSGDGIVSDNFGSNSENTDLALQADGKIVTGGRRGTGLPTQFLLARYNATSVSTSIEVNVSVSPATGSEAATTSVTVTATAASAVSGAQTVDVALSGSGVTSGDFTGSIPAQITIPNGMVSGDFTVAINDDGAIEGPETATFTISNPSSGLTLGSTTSDSVDITDNDFPVVSTPDLDPGSDSGSSNTDNITNDDTPTFTGTATAGSTVTLSSDVDGVIGSATATTGTWTITASILMETDHAITATAVFNSVSSGPSGALNISIDKTPPAVPTGLDLVAASDTGSSDTDDITMDDTPDIAGDGEGGSLVTLNSDLDGDVGTATPSSPFTITTSMLQEGTHQFTATAADTAGNSSAASSPPLTVVIDTTGPVIAGIPPKRLVVNAPVGATSVNVTYGPVAATDLSPASPAVDCTPPDGGAFDLGSTTVTCSATDTAGNTTNDSFEVLVLESAPSPGARVLETVSLRGDAVTGAGIPAGATILIHNHAFLNDAGKIIMETSLLGAGLNNVAVLAGGGAGSLAPLAVKGLAEPAGGVYGIFDHLAVNRSGQTAFQSLVAGSAHFSGSATDVVSSSVRVNQAAPGGGTFQVLYQPALPSSGDLVTPGLLFLGGATTLDNNTGLWSSAAGGTLVVREGDAVASLGGGATYGQLFNRIVASPQNNRIAWPAFLGGTAAGGAALFVGAPGAEAAVAQKGGAAPGTAESFNTFLGEAVNSSGEYVMRASLSPAGALEGVWSTAGGAGLQLVALEDEPVPCLPASSGVVFSHFRTVAVGDDGTVCFFAYLKGTLVDSTNDGSVWTRDPAGTMHLIAREGDAAPNSGGALLLTISENIACNSAGAVAYQSTLTGGSVLATNNFGIWLDRGAADPLPLLILRKGDTFELVPGVTRTVLGLGFESVSNSGGGTGGYGSALDGNGKLLLKLSLDGGKSGIFTIGVAP